MLRFLGRKYRKAPYRYLNAHQCWWVERRLTQEYRRGYNDGQRECIESAIEMAQTIITEKGMEDE